MDVRLTPSCVAGEVRAPPSKSYTHRAILAAGAGAGGRIARPLVSADTRSTMRVVEAFGGTVDLGDDDANVTGFDGAPGVPADVIDCANSGTTMRLSIGLAALVDGMTVFTGDDSLRDRPQEQLLDAIEQLGGWARSTRGNGRAPVVIEGAVSGGAVTIPGDVSSQYISALLMAGGLTDEGIEVELTTPLKSSPYVDVTIEVLDAFGVEATAIDDGFHVPGGQRYRRTDAYAVPGDFSSVSYLLAAGAIAGDDRVEIRGAYPSAQGDTAIVDVVDRMGADVDWQRDAGRLTVAQGDLSGTTVDVADTPDLLPTIAALGAVADGETRITNCEHVRYKETDRVAAMATELSRLGASVDATRDTLTVRGGESELVGTRVPGYADHRIIMALSLVGLVASGETIIEDADHVAVSFPSFFDVLADLGADLTKR